MSDTAAFLVALLLAYLAGSIPFGLLLGFARGVDIRAHGSGNIGATNAMRVLGKKVGSLCFALDVLKGLLPTLLLGLWLGVAANRFPTTAQAFMHLALAAATIVGHVFPVWLRFKGGKGVATGFGAMLGVFPQITLPALGAVVVWIACARVTRYVSLSSIVAALCLAPFVAAGAMLASRGETIGAFEAAARAWPYWTVGLAMALLVVVRHRENIRRLLDGTERRLGGASRRPGTTPDP